MGVGVRGSGLWTGADPCPGEWNAPSFSYNMTSFTGMAEVEARRPALEALVRRWVELMDREASRAVRDGRRR
ncbi:MAG TPA: hypothetical protein VG411_04715 [Actinomycetota bacterium]|nr:hypothetical protein [Actinomycetota bacterium]